MTNFKSQFLSAVGHPAITPHSCQYGFESVARLLDFHYLLILYTHPHCLQLGQLSVNLHGPEENFLWSWMQVYCHSVFIKHQEPSLLLPWYSIGLSCYNIEIHQFIKNYFYKKCFIVSFWPLREKAVLYLCWEGLFVQSRNPICSAGTRPALLYHVVLVFTASLTQW